MKTRIITLESHDDLISVRDQLSWAKTPRILLVWPKYEKVTLRQVDLKVLQRHAATLGAQLGLVTRTRRVRADAEALGIPVFESTGQAQRVAWPRVKRKRLRRWAPDRTLREQRDQLPVAEEAWRALPAVRVGAFILGVLSVLAVVALFIPRARVTLKPVTKTQTVVLSVSANPSLNSVFITGAVPAHEKRVVVNGTQTVIVTGEGIVPESKAKGVVEFRNLTEQAVAIPVGTVVRTADAIQFVTTEAGEVEAGVDRTLVLTVEAVRGGLAGNVEAEMINAIEGRLGLSLAVTNPEATAGGRERASVQASDSDRTRVKNLLMQMLEKDARQKITDELKPGDFLFDNTLAVTQTLSEKYDPPPGAVGTNLTLTMEVEFSVQYTSASDLTKLATLAMNASLPPDFSASSNAVTLKQLTNPFRADDGFMHWTMRAERSITQTFDPVQVTQLVQGLKVSAAQANLRKKLPAESSPQISLSPAWWPRIPVLPFRIEVVTK